jgi:hypothetical protein
MHLNRRSFLGILGAAVAGKTLIASSQETISTGLSVDHESFDLASRVAAGSVEYVADKRFYREQICKCFVVPVEMITSVKSISYRDLVALENAVAPHYRDAAT